jgi:GNAT superfamily N-acetyltransferase
VELDDDTGDLARRLLAGPAGEGPAARVAATGRPRTYALVDLTAEAPGWVAVAAVIGAGTADPVLAEILVEHAHRGQGHERALLDAVADRMRACGARRLEIAGGLTLDL